MKLSLKALLIAALASTGLAAHIGGLQAHQDVPQVIGRANVEVRDDAQHNIRRAVVVERDLDEVKAQLAQQGFIPWPKSRVDPSASLEARDSWSWVQKQDKDDPDGVDFDEDD